MNKIEIIRAIAEQSRHKSVSGIFGTVIVEACVLELNKPFDLSAAKSKIDSGSYLLKQIEICDKEVNELIVELANAQKNPLIFPFTDEEIQERRNTISDLSQNKYGFIKQLETLINEF